MFELSPSGAGWTENILFISQTIPSMGGIRSPESPLIATVS